MKKILALVLLIAAVLLVGCGQDNKTTNDNESLSANELQFKSYGDGTCAIVGVGSFSGDTLTIPNTSPDGDKVTRIEKNAIYNNGSIKNLDLSGVDIKLEDDAIVSCDIEKITIENSNVEFGDRSISLCSDLLNVSIDDSDISFGEYVFYKDGKEIDLTVNKSTVNCSNDAFADAGFKTLSFSDCILTTNDRAFSQLEQATDIDFSNCDISFGKYSFYRSGSNLTVSFSEQRPKFCVKSKMQ